MYAILETGGKQYKVNEGDIVYVEKLEVEEEKDITFDTVIALSDDGKVKCGKPYVKGARVIGKVLSHGKGNKIIVFKFKAKKGYKRTNGHRQPYTKIQIMKIEKSQPKKEA